MLLSVEELYEKLRKAIQEGDVDAAKETATKLVEVGGDPLKGIEVMSESIKELGDKFERMEVFLPDLLIAADAMKEAIDALSPHIPKERFEQTMKGTVLIGTIQGDIHDIGKNIVALMLRAAGFNVIDLGRDVPVDKFIEEAEKMKADIIGVSILMTAGRGYMKELIDLLEKRGLRSKYFLIAGGGGVTEQWIRSIGYDGFGEDAVKSVSLVTELMGAKRGG